MRTGKLGKASNWLLFAVLLAANSASMAGEQPFAPKEATYRKHKPGTAEVKIGDFPAQVRRKAISGERVSSPNARAHFGFTTYGEGILKNASIEMGTTCIELTKVGAAEKVVRKTGILLSGKTTTCLGQKRIGTNSSVVIEQDPDGRFTVAVLAGEAVIGERVATMVDEDYDIANQYPRISPSVGLGTSGYTSLYPSSGGLLIGNVNAFIPLRQDRARSILYSYTALGSNFDGFWGASTEIGYRWFTPANKSTSSIYMGYSGFDSPSCFVNLINLGGQWERARWRFGASSGLKAGGCNAGFSFGALNISAPVAKLGKSRSAYLSLTPYLIWGGNIASPFNYEDGGSSIAPGGRISVQVPITDTVSVDAFGGLDSIYGASIGGKLTIRLPAGGKVVRDPNLDDQGLRGEQDITAADQSIPEADYGGNLVVRESFKAAFSSEGVQTGEAVRMSSEEMASLITEYLEGFDPLAESNRIAAAAANHGALTTRVAGILGVYHLETASRPVSETVQQPFDTTVFPTATYACAASGDAKDYAEDELRKDGKDSAADKVAAADTIYVGRGDKVADGWSVTTSKSRAYRVANGSVCGEINSYIRGDNSYEGPSNPLQKIVLD